MADGRAVADDLGDLSQIVQITVDLGVGGLGMLPDQQEQPGIEQQQPAARAEHRHIVVWKGQLGDQIAAQGRRAQSHQVAHHPADADQAALVLLAHQLGQQPVKEGE